jgi:hypothetical protein
MLRLRQSDACHVDRIKVRGPLDGQHAEGRLSTSRQQLTVIRRVVFNDLLTHSIKIIRGSHCSIT